MKFFTKKRRADGVEIAHYHGEGFCNTSQTYSSSEGFASEDAFQLPKVEVYRAKNDTKGSSVFLIDKSYIHRGAKLDISFSITYPYDELTVFEFPKNCAECPIGFQSHGECGRNVPFTGEDYKQRPATCKLKKANYDDVKRIIKHNVNHYFTILNSR